MSCVFVHSTDRSLFRGSVSVTDDSKLMFRKFLIEFILPSLNGSLSAAPGGNEQFVLKQPPPHLVPPQSGSNSPPLPGPPWVFLDNMCLWGERREPSAQREGRVYLVQAVLGWWLTSAGRWLKLNGSLHTALSSSSSSSSSPIGPLTSPTQRAPPCAGCGLRRMAEQPSERGSF